MSHFWGKSFNLKSYFNSVSEAFLFEYWNTHCWSIKAAHSCKTWCNWSAMQNTRAVIFLFIYTFIFKHSKLTWYSNWGQLACKLQSDVSDALWVPLTVHLLSTLPQLPYGSRQCGAVLLVPFSVPWFENTMILQCQWTFTVSLRKRGDKNLNAWS